MTLQLVLFDDARAQDWQPLTLTRPAGELLFGAYTQRERAERVFGGRCIGHVAGAHLQGYGEHDGAPCIDPSEVGTAAPRLYLLSRAVPAWQTPSAWPSRTSRVVMNGQGIGWYVPAGEPALDRAALLDAGDGRNDVVTLDGVVLEDVWELIARNPAQVTADAAAARARGLRARGLPAHTQLIGSVDDVLLGADVTIEPGVVIDVEHGPVWLADGVTLRAFTRLAGPSYIGRGSTVLGGAIAEVSVGPVCKVHGEMEASVVLGYANKAHDGFLGHAYLGRWVNLGALTTNSDLKNNYGTIRLWTPNGDVDTGEIKIGCFLGDHVKTGIGTMLNTGTVVGAGSNLYGAAMPPKYVPPFSWGSGNDLTGYALDRFLQTAETVMARRGVELEPGMRNVLTRAHELGRKDS